MTVCIAGGVHWCVCVARCTSRPAVLCCPMHPNWSFIDSPANLARHFQWARSLGDVSFRAPPTCGRPVSVGVGDRTHIIIARRSYGYGSRYQTALDNITWCDSFVLSRLSHYHQCAASFRYIMYNRCVCI